MDKLKIKNSKLINSAFFVSSLTITSLAIGACSSSTITKKNKKPNIVFILADDLGYGDISSFNKDAKINTQNIDKLASRGVMFTDAHTNSSVSTPTRYGIITGRYSWRTTLKQSVLSGYSKSMIKPDRLTIAGFLKNNGYNTAYIGKWHMGWNWALKDSTKTNDYLNKLRIIANVDYTKPITNGPKEHGFNYSFGFCGSLDMPPYVWVENGMSTMVPNNKTKNTDDYAFWRSGPTSADFTHEQVLPRIKDKAVEYIKNAASTMQGNDIARKPFFLYLPLSAPHTPIIPNEEFKGKSGLNSPYADFVLMVDWVVGKVVNAIEEAGIADNTIIIFTSDNGCSPRANYEQLLSKGHNPSYIFRGSKADIFEGGHRVPYIVVWPGKIKHAISKQLVCTTDLFATVADLLNVKLPENAAEDSFSYLQALHLKSSSKNKDNALSYTHPRTSIIHHSINGSFAYRKGPWKVCFCPGSGGWSNPRPGSKNIKGMPSFQVYNLDTDIQEKHNVQAQHPEIIEEYKKEILTIINNGRSNAGPKEINDGIDKWTQFDKLKNLK